MICSITRIQCLRKGKKKKESVISLLDIFKPDVIPSAKHLTGGVPPRNTALYQDRARDIILAVDAVITFINRAA